MKKIALGWLLLLLLPGCIGNMAVDPIDYVDPFIGTGGHGHTYPGATSPYGAVQLSPDIRRDNWDACAGYHYSDSTIIGFSHTHLSGTGAIRPGRHSLSSHLQGNGQRSRTLHSRTHWFLPQG